MWDNRAGGNSTVVTAPESASKPNPEASGEVTSYVSGVATFNSSTLETAILIISALVQFTNYQVRSEFSVAKFYLPWQLELTLPALDSLRLAVVPQRTASFRSENSMMLSI